MPLALILFLKQLKVLIVSYLKKQSDSKKVLKYMRNVDLLPHPKPYLNNNASNKEKEWILLYLLDLF